MGKIFTSDTTSAINVSMTVEPKCYDDRYTAEVQFAELKVWNELSRMFCSVKALVEIIDTENSRNTVIVSIEENKAALPSLSKDITYRFDDEFVKIDSHTSTDHRQQVDIYDIVDRWLEIDVRIEGI